MKHFQKILILLCLLFGSCSFFKKSLEEKRIVTITSEPTDAEIYSIEGEKIGETPKTLTETELKTLLKGDHLNFIVRKGGFVEREIGSTIQAITEIKLKLHPLTPDRFNDIILHAYRNELNLLVREVLQIQGLIFLNKNQDAVDKTILFQKKFPNVAASHTLMGNIYLEQGKAREAREQFLRALSIDQKDETAARALKNME